MDTKSKILESDAMAKRLKKLRTEYKYIGTDGKQHHLSHAVLSQRLEEFGVSVSVSTLKNYEAPAINSSKALSNTGMNIKTLSALAKLYNVTADYILGLSDVPSISVSKQQAAKTTGLSERAIDRVKYLMQHKGSKEAKAFNTLLGRGELTSLLREIVHTADEVKQIHEATIQMASTIDNESVWRDYRRKLWHIKRDFSDAVERIFSTFTGIATAEHRIEKALDEIGKEQARMIFLEDMELQFEEADNAEEE